MTTLQLPTASAIFDNDVMTHGAPQGNYLQRSATHLRSNVKPWPKNVNKVRKGLIKRVCFASGIKFLNKKDTSTGEPFRRISVQVFASRCFYNLIF